MSESKHTPGPWTTDYVMDEAILDVILDYQPPGAGNPTVIASVYADDEPHRLHTIDQKQANANARLMAAAPDLLAACEDALETGERDMQHILDNGRLRDVLRAAIAKARGER